MSSKLIYLSIFWAILISFVLFILFVIFVLRQRRRTLPQSKLVSLMIVMGSGGHTSEMLSLISGLKLGSANGKYCPVTFVTANNDELSKQKVRQLITKEGLNEDTNDCRLLSITRSRSVGQSYWTSIVTTLTSLSDSISLMLDVRPQLIICNGPAICVPICFAAKFLSPNVCVVFAESFCRTQSLSLTGKILYYLPICDHFFVQWPQITQKYKRTKCIGLLV